MQMSEDLTNNFCPYCQMPLSLLKSQVVTLHLEVCSKQPDRSSLKPCPNELNCDSTMICHYERYSHLSLAEKRSCKTNSKTSLIEKSSALSKILACDNGNYSSEDFAGTLCFISKKRRRYSKCRKHSSDNPTIKPELNFNCNGFVNSDNLRRNNVSKSNSTCTSVKDSQNKEILPTNFNLTLSSVQCSIFDSSNQNVQCKIDSKYQKNSTQPLKCASCTPVKIKNNIVSSWSPFNKNSENKSRYNTSSPKQKQGDIRTMLFGFKPKASPAQVASKEEKHFDFTNKRRQCPFYKKIDGASIAVDAFSYGAIPGINYYFLTHFHSDHYMGLNKKFQSDIYCSYVTGNLLHSRLKIEETNIKRLPLNQSISIGNVLVTLFEANHCPGAVLLLFRLQNGKLILHTGDFRADKTLQNTIKDLHCKIDIVYLDTTYLDPLYNFPPQSEVINFVTDNIERIVSLNSKTLIVTGTYCIGKEKIFTAIAERLGVKVCVSKEKIKVLNCLNDQELNNLLTTDVRSTNLHVLPMNKLNMLCLQEYLKRFEASFDQLVAIKPTGWTFKGTSTSLKNLKPSISGKVMIYGVPYSEHSSFLELKQFIELLKPNRVIPTVNVGKAESRKKMENFFNLWKRK